MACPMVVATIGTWGAPVSSSSNSAQTASAPPNGATCRCRAASARTAASTPSASASSSNSFWKVAEPHRLAVARALGRPAVGLDELDRPAVAGADLPRLPRAGRESATRLAALPAGFVTGLCTRHLDGNMQSRSRSLAAGLAYRGFTLASKLLHPSARAREKFGRPGASCWLLAVGGQHRYRCGKRRAG